MHIGETIVAIRKDLGMTQAELAKKMGVKPQTISQYERGIKNPKPDTIKKFADALGVDAASLYAISAGQRDARVFMNMGVSAAYIAKLAEQYPNELQNAGIKPALLAEAAAQAQLTLQSTGTSAAELAEAAELAQRMLQRQPKAQPTKKPERPTNSTPHSPAGIIPDAAGAAPAQVEQLLQDFNKLNSAGQEKALERVHELTEVPRYTSPAVTPAPASTAESVQAAPQSSAVNTDTPKVD